MIRMVLISEAGWLKHVDRLMEVPMKVNIFHIKLVNRSTAGYSQAENHTYNGWFDNRAKSLVTIYSNLLTFSINNQPSFVSL